jgi:hypothetical protein
MPTIDYYCFDGDPSNGIAPHRPSIEHLGGEAMEDYPGEPVDPDHGLPANAENQRNQVAARLAALTPYLSFSVEFPSGPDVVDQQQARSSNATLTPNSTGTGVTEITWPANSFPPAVVKPKAYLNAGPGMIWAEPISNGVRVHTYNSAGAAADLAFTVDVA